MTKTGRKLVLDTDWITLPTAAHGAAHTFLYKSEIEFILIKTDTNIRFRRIFPTNAEAGLGNVDWDHRNGEEYYIFKIDPAQKVIITGSPTVRFFRCPQEEERVSIYDDCTIKTPLWKREKRGRPWEAEDVYQERDADADQTFPPEHLAEVGRRYKAWRAARKKNLFVYLMTPEDLRDREFDVLRETGISFVADVPWVS